MFQVSLDDNGPFPLTPGEVSVESEASYHLYLRAETQGQPSTRWQRAPGGGGRRCRCGLFAAASTPLCVESPHLMELVGRVFITKKSGLEKADSYTQKLRHKYLTFQLATGRTLGIRIQKIRQGLGTPPSPQSGLAFSVQCPLSPRYHRLHGGHSSRREAKPGDSRDGGGGNHGLLVLKENHKIFI